MIWDMVKGYLGYPDFQVWAVIESEELSQKPLQGLEKGS